MNTPTPAVRPTKAPVLLFVGLAWLVTALSFASHHGMLDAILEQRIAGCARGLVIFTFGLFLGKLKLRNTLAGNTAKATADGLAGWALVLAGLATVALFSVDSLQQARLLSLLVGIGVMAVSVAAWSWMLRNTLSGAPPTDDATNSADKAVKRKRLFSVLLLIAYVYIAATACAAFLAAENSWFSGLAPWMVVLFWTMYITGSAAFVELRSRAPGETRAPETAPAGST